MSNRGLGPKLRAELDLVVEQAVRRGVTYRAMRAELGEALALAAVNVHQSQNVAAHKLKVHRNFVLGLRRRAYKRRGIAHKDFRFIEGRHHAKIIRPKPGERQESHVKQQQP